MFTTILSIASVGIGALGIILKLWWKKKTLQDKIMDGQAKEISTLIKVPQAIEKVDAENTSTIIKINSGISNSDAASMLNRKP